MSYDPYYGPYADPYGGYGAYDGYDAYGAVPYGPYPEDYYGYAYDVDPYAGAYGYGGVDPYYGGDAYGYGYGGPDRQVVYEPDVRVRPTLDVQYRPVEYVVDELAYPQPYMDALVDLGYHGPWTKNYYDRPRPETDSDDSEEEEERPCRRRKPCRRRGVTETDLQNLLDRFEEELDLKFGGRRRRKGGLLGQWQDILDKYPGKRSAKIVELDDDDDLDDLRTRKQLVKAAAQAKRDLLLQKALEFNKDCPVPGKVHEPAKQIVHIDFGGKRPQAPAAVPAPAVHVVQPNPAATARAYSSGAVTCVPAAPTRVIYQ